MTWECFSHNCPFVWGIHVTGGFPSQRDSNADLWYFLCCHNQLSVEHKSRITGDFRHQDGKTPILWLQYKTVLHPGQTINAQIDDSPNLLMIFKLHMELDAKRFVTRHCPPPSVKYLPGTKKIKHPFVAMDGGCNCQCRDHLTMVSPRLPLHIVRWSLGKSLGDLDEMLDKWFHFNFSNWWLWCVWWNRPRLIVTSCC